MKTRNPHERIDRMNLAMDRLIASRIRADPSVVNIAKDNLRRWMAQDRDYVHPVHAEWLDILQFLEPSELADFLESDTPKANRLRQSSPFTGILTENERLAILHEREEVPI